LIFAQHILKVDWQKTERSETENIQFSKQTLPLGTILVLGSSNFPLAYSTLGGDTIAALAAGCCVVLKAHPMHAGTSSLVAQCIAQTLQQWALSPFVFSHVLDDSYYWASTFAQESAVKAIGFTGSIKGGRALMNLAAARPEPIPVFAEMGSLNPVIISPNHHQEALAQIAKKLASSIYTDAGQFCTKPGLILVQTEEANIFESVLLEELAHLPATPMLHPDIHAKFEARKRQVFQNKGFTRAENQEQLEGIFARWGIAKTQLQDLFNASSALEEVFGPFAVVCSYENIADLTKLFNILGGQLTLSIFTQEAQPNVQLLAAAQKIAGRIILNGVPTGVRVLEAMHHGGPYPASSDARFTAVGPDSIKRFTKEICMQVHDAL
jgi:NADP-dependent aldehyde dehydrogenase